MRFGSTNEEKEKALYSHICSKKMKHDDFSDDEFHRYVSLTVIFGVVSKIILRNVEETRRKNRDVYSCEVRLFLC